MSAQSQVDLALDVRETSHSSAGMLAYVRMLRRLLPVVAPELALAEFGTGDNFDAQEQLGMPLFLARLRPRLVHFPTPYVPRFVAFPHVVTVHDAIDLEFPQYAKPQVGPYWRRIVGPVLRSARAVITDDEATLVSLERYLRVDPKRVRVIPLGVDAPEPLPPPLVRARPYLFYAGNQRPHKDLPTLVRAWAALPPAYELDLVLTGPENAALRELGARGTQGTLVFTGERSDAEIWSLHRGALAYVQPALREGFGLPMLEALRCGTPVIAARPAIPRALAHAVAAFAPGDVDALRSLLIATLDDRSTAQAAARSGQAATAHLTWERTARATAAVYHEVLG